MPDSRLVRIALVFSGLGWFIFLMSAFAITEGNRWIVQWVGIAGIALAVLSAVVVGLVWAWRPDAIRRQEP